MEILVIIAAVLVIAFLIYRSTTPKALEFLDVNKDGKVDAKDAKVAADVNKDGKVDVQDAKTAVKKTKAAAKTAVKKVATTRGRKPKKA